MTGVGWGGGGRWFVTCYDLFSFNWHLTLFTFQLASRSWLRVLKAFLSHDVSGQGWQWERTALCRWQRASNKRKRKWTCRIKVRPHLCQNSKHTQKNISSNMCWLWMKRLLCCRGQILYTHAKTSLEHRAATTNSLSQNIYATALCETQSQFPLFPRISRLSVSHHNERLYWGFGRLGALYESVLSCLMWQIAVGFMDDVPQAELSVGLSFWAELKFNMTLGQHLWC